MKFYDTNALLLLLDEAFKEKFLISVETLRELESIKTNRLKDEDIKYRAREVTRLLMEHENMFIPVPYDCDDDCQPDDKIINSCIYANRNFADILEYTTIKYPGWNKDDFKDIVFVTNDISCRNIAKHYYDIKTSSVFIDEKDNYTGFKEVVMSDEDMAYFYEHLMENIYDLLVNEYLIVKNQEGEVVDKYYWDGVQHQVASFKKVTSLMLGDIKPLKNDIYQTCALSALQNNQIVMLKGKAGTGKSYLALGYLMAQLEKHKIEKIVMFCNPVATRNAAKLGFLPGSRNEKILDSQIGNMLSAKIGDRFQVDRLISENRLLLLPMSDIRGFDTTGMKAGIYITEAQNLNIDLMKLALQRIGEDCSLIIDGDYSQQVDLDVYAGNNNGMKRVSEVFRGQDFYAEIELQNIYRSRIAQVAEMM